MTRNDLTKLTWSDKIEIKQNDWSYVLKLLDKINEQDDADTMNDLCIRKAKNYTLFDALDLYFLKIPVLWSPRICSHINISFVAADLSAILL